MTRCHRAGRPCGPTIAASGADRVRVDGLLVNGGGATGTGVVATTTISGITISLPLLDQLGAVGVPISLLAVVLITCTTPGSGTSAAAHGAPHPPCRWRRATGAGTRPEGDRR